MKRIHKVLTGMLSILALCAAAGAQDADPQPVAPATAASPSLTVSKHGSSDDWEFGVGIYLWGADIGGETHTGSGVDVGFDDLIDNLKMAFMGSFGARKGRWGGMLDVIYMDVGNDSSFNQSIFGNDIGVDANLDLKTWILTPAVTYSAIQSEKVRLDLLGGARYLSMDMALDINFGPPLSIQSTIASSLDIWDGIVGVKGDLHLTEKWFVPYYFDVGAGGSDLTWQAMAGIGYRFSKFVEVVATYRYLAWEFDSSSAVDRMNIRGPLLGIEFSF